MGQNAVRWTDKSALELAGGGDPVDAKTGVVGAREESVS